MSDNENIEISDDVIDLEEIEVQDKDPYDRTLYLVVADESNGFEVALKYGASLAKARRSHLGILFVLDVDDFQHWSGVENKMRAELREHAEKFLKKAAQKVYDFKGIYPALYIREGNKVTEVRKLIEEEQVIRSVVLAAGSDKSGQDELLSDFIDKGLSNLTVPLTIIPEHLGGEH